MLYLYTLQNYLKVGSLVYSDRLLGSLPHNLYVKDLFYFLQVLNLKDLLEERLKPINLSYIVSSNANIIDVD